MTTSFNNLPRRRVGNLKLASGVKLHLQSCDVSLGLPAKGVQGVNVLNINSANRIDIKCDAPVGIRVRMRHGGIGVLNPSTNAKSPDAGEKGKADE